MRRLERKGLMLVLSSPSGAGKSTLSRLLLEQDDNVHLSVSATTRPRRPSEVEGVHYHFRPVATFTSMIDSGAMLEWADVHGHRYGTPRAEVETHIAAGRDVLFDIDWQGTRQLYEKARERIVSIFVLPPNMAELSARLERRAEDHGKVIAKRLQNARAEMTHWREYDYVLVNDDLHATFDAVKAILRAERLRRSRWRGFGGFVDSLRAERTDSARIGGDLPTQ